MAGTTQLSDLQARQGVMLGQMRYVLGISMVLSVLGMLIAISAS